MYYSIYFCKLLKVFFQIEDNPEFPQTFELVTVEECKFMPVPTHINKIQFRIAEITIGAKYISIMGETWGEYGDIIEARLWTYFTLKELDIILLENVNLVYSRGGLVLSNIKQFTRMTVCPNTNQFGKIPNTI